MLVKELQGLGLRVDLVDDGSLVDAEKVIASSSPADESTAKSEDGEKETFLDESDELGDIEDGMSVQDIDEIDEIKEEA